MTEGATNILSEFDYEDLLAQWLDLEAALGVVLLHPRRINQLQSRIEQLANWMVSLMQKNTDVGLYILFQLSNASVVGYSASHALICTALAYHLTPVLHVPLEYRNPLLHAMLTMNIGMTALQNELSKQSTPLSVEQTEQINTHAMRGYTILQEQGIEDVTWLMLVEKHHVFHDRTESPKNPKEEVLAIMSAIDRFGALISPRRTREAKTGLMAMQRLISSGNAFTIKLAKLLVSRIGVYPPGTFVELNDGRLAVVLLRKLGHPKHPIVAILTNNKGCVLQNPVLHPTHLGGADIALAVASNRVDLILNHYKILCLAGRAKHR